MVLFSMVYFLAQVSWLRHGEGLSAPGWAVEHDEQGNDEQVLLWFD